MKTWLSLMLGILWVTLCATSAAADPGVQVVQCHEDPPGSDNWHYSFFVCTGTFNANDFHLQLTTGEIAEGTEILGCDIPALPGYGCSYTPSVASWTFPTVGSFECIPGIADMYLSISIHTPDESTVVTELFTLNGNIVGAFTSLVSCPPVAVEPSTWGMIKSLYED